MIDIFSPKIKTEWHNHRCPYCHKSKNIKHEPNDVCQMVGGDHNYPCITHLQDYRRRFGSISDDLLEPYLTPEAKERIKEVAPDAVSDFLDFRDAVRTAEQMKEARNNSRNNLQAKPAIQLSPEENFKREKEAREHLMDTADRLTYDEVKAEIEKEEKP